MFLNAPYFYALRILMPSLKLVCLPEAESSDSSTPSESTANAPALTAVTNAAPVPPAASSLTSLYPPPNSLPPPVVPSAASNVITASTHPPPPGPPPTTGTTTATAGVTAAKPLQPLSLYLPPNSPHPPVLSTASGAASGNPTAVNDELGGVTASISVAYVGIAADDKSIEVSDGPSLSQSVVLYSVLPDSMSLLPHTVALIDYGDVVIIRVNTPSEPKTETGTGGDDLGNALKCCITHF